MNWDNWNPNEKGGKNNLTWAITWKKVVAIAGLVLIFYEAMFAREVNLVIVLAALLMMGYPVARWLDKLQ